MFILLMTNRIGLAQDTVQTLRFTDLSAIKLDSGLSIERISSEGTNYLRIAMSTAASTTPAVYFLTARVVPGRKYTYFIKGVKNSLCRAMHYVTSPLGDVVWPGADVEAGVSRTVFTAPENIPEVTLALGFLCPTEEGFVLIESISLVEGDVKLSASAISVSQKPKTWVIWVYALAMLSLAIMLLFSAWNTFSFKAARKKPSSNTTASPDRPPRITC